MVLSLDPSFPPLAPAWTSHRPPSPAPILFSGLLTTLGVACVSPALSWALPSLLGPAPYPGGPLASTWGEPSLLPLGSESGSPARVGMGVPGLCRIRLEGCPFLGGLLGASEGRAGIRVPGRQRGALRALPLAAASVPRGAVLAERPAGRPGSRAMGRERVRRDVGGGAGGTGMNAQSPL